MSFFSLIASANSWMAAFLSQAPCAAEKRGESVCFRTRFSAIDMSPTSPIVLRSSGTSATPSSMKLRAE